MASESKSLVSWIVRDQLGRTRRASVYRSKSLVWWMVRDPLRQRSKRKEHHCLNPWYRG